MATNYYAKRIPTVKDYTELVDKIKNCPIAESIKYSLNPCSSGCWFSQA